MGVCDFCSAPAPFFAIYPTDDLDEETRFAFFTCFQCVDKNEGAQLVPAHTGSIQKHNLYCRERVQSLTAYIAEHGSDGRGFAIHFAATAIAEGLRSFLTPTLIDGVPISSRENEL